jgi:NAD-dependent SIR2 family protein deacetylase
MVFYELLFSDDEDRTVECDNCGRVIKGNEKVEWIDRDKQIFKCPDCKQEIKL